MCNSEIISTTCMLAGITETIHTYEGWKARGFQVVKGQKARIKIPVWKAKTEAQIKRAQEKNPDAEIGRFYMKEASFFTESQVQPISETGD